MKVNGAGLNPDSILVNAHNLPYGQRLFYSAENVF